MFRLAHVLGKTVAEIEQMTRTEFLEWLAFFAIVKEEHKRV